MIEFAVTGDWLEEGQGTWVLAVDPVGDRLLLADADGSLHWHYIADCKLVKASTPDIPRAVILVQPNQPAALTIPSAMPNREMRRNGGF